jgi:hypothetical protein
MRKALLLLSMLVCSVASATAQISIGIALPHLSIGINVPVYPELVPLPGYPVYYAPQLESNYFFYDGMYWVYDDDNWYASSWYDGPWSPVGPEFVPVFVLRIPVRYYRRPPVYFSGWASDAPPRWGDHWGHDWSQRRSGWDRWNRNAAHAPPPLPVYQRQYAGDRYPRRVEQQRDLQRQNYQYQPRNPVVRQHYQALGVQPAPAPARRVTQGARQPGNPEQRSARQPNPSPRQDAPAVAQSRPQQQRADRASPGEQRGQGGKHGGDRGQERGQDERK